MSKAVLALPFALVACGGASSDPPIPDMPSYAVDVHPIFESHCVKCHGANDMLNDALNADGTPSGLGAPSICYLSNYEDRGDCSDAGVAAGACKRGAHFCTIPMGDPPASLIEAYVIILTQAQGGMPPLPEPGISGREKEVIRRWLANPIP